MERIITVFFHSRLHEETIRMIIEKHNLKIVDKNPDNPWIFTVEYPQELSVNAVCAIFRNHPDCYQINE
jgi:hypothetical protein